MSGLGHDFPDPLHYLALLERRRMRSIRRRRWWAGRIHRTAPKARLSKRGKREYVQVQETFLMAEVTKAVEDALRLRAISFDAVKIFYCLDLQNYPFSTTTLAQLTPVQEGVL